MACAEIRTTSNNEVGTWRLLSFIESKMPILVNRKTLAKLPEGAMNWTEVTPAPI